ncbi:hypothetical protein HDEF_1579 [Candidatus Hamiltonella defensa 5AT (Acyrthosiphon pisum)]|uniref:Uncharacterized protein n=1 Tax=Hamiltonella defensa subsp. Acyrthosiphon pisum (strain 5AT) TaxID=572265 RepID=C4K6K1_HAMD5|nr:hypothetical protein HDEF_1579 [Candidatus Hamiltonella defensa 5AT (Acyrthosiphon pisum)]
MTLNIVGAFLWMTLAGQPDCFPNTESGYQEMA